VAKADLFHIQVAMWSEIVQAFKYPFIGERYPKRFLLGCAISLVPLLGTLITAGYAVRSTRGVMEESGEIPRWEDFIGLLLLGLKGLGIFCIYSLVSLVPFSLGLFFILVIPYIVAVNIGFIFLILSSILFLSSAFVVPMGILFMIRAGGSFRAALRFEDVLIAVKKMASTYVLRSLSVWVIGVLFLVVMLLVISIPFGHFFAMIPAFYFLLIASYIFGMEGRLDFAGAETGDTNKD
jgi:hypothetical protein